MLPDQKPSNASIRNRFSKAKLLNSKWTALEVSKKEKHFLVTEVIREEESQQITGCILQAVMTKNEYTLTPDDLKDASRWRIGWK